MTSKAGAPVGDMDAPPPILTSSPPAVDDANKKKGFKKLASKVYACRELQSPRCSIQTTAIAATADVPPRRLPQCLGR